MWRNIRVTEMSEKSEGSTKDIKKFIYISNSRKCYRHQKEFNIHISEAYRTLNGHDQGKQNEAKTNKKNTSYNS